MAGMIGSLAGIGMSAYGMQQQKKQQEQQKAAAMQMALLNQQINKVYGNQAKLEYRRRSMEIFREQQRARSESLATTTAQGAAGEGSSALGGAYGQIGGQVGGSLLKNSQDYRSYLELQKLYNQMAIVAGMAGQSSSSMGVSFGSFAGPLQKIFSAFGQAGVMGSN
jgi:hypothetical protein